MKASRYDEPEDDPVEDLDNDSELAKIKQVALKGLKELELFQLQSPFQDERTPESSLKKWAGIIEGATSEDQVKTLAEEINVSLLTHNITL